jgi:hypothetical protein
MRIGFTSDRRLLAEAAPDVKAATRELHSSKIAAPPFWLYERDREQFDA